MSGSWNRSHFFSYISNSLSCVVANFSWLFYVALLFTLNLYLRPLAIHLSKFFLSWFCKLATPNWVSVSTLRWPPNQNFKILSISCICLCFSLNFVMMLLNHRCYKAPIFTIIINKIILILHSIGSEAKKFFIVFVQEANESSVELFYHLSVNKFFLESGV